MKDEENNFDSRLQVSPVDETTKRLYLLYAQEVSGRTFPRIEDGLKTIHRRILYTASLSRGKRFVKCSKLVGDIMGDYHPHGDQAIYGAIIRLCQSFSCRYPLIKGQGNIGSIDHPSSFAQMRYTEWSKPPILNGFIDDLTGNMKQEVVDFEPNYDGSLQEPTVLPVTFPHLLANGVEGIGVGMATNIPSHNIGELVDANIAYINNPDITLDGLMEYIQGPDLCTGGIIYNSASIRELYETGKGSILVRGRCHYEMNGKYPRIVITEIPFQTTKVDIIETIGRLIDEEKISGIRNVFDESRYEKIRLIIELQPDSDQDYIREFLFRSTKLHSKIHYEMRVLYNSKPEVITLKRYFEIFTEFRSAVIRRSISYIIKRAKEKREILLSIAITSKHSDKIVEIIKNFLSSEAKQIIKDTLWDTTQLYNDEVCDEKSQYLSKTQIDYIVGTMRLHDISKDRYSHAIEEIKKLNELIKEKEIILFDKLKVDQEIIKGLNEAKDKYGDPRRSEISNSNIYNNIDDLIRSEDVMVIVDKRDYIKRILIDSYPTQNRGGKGRIISKDVKSIILTNTRDKLMVCTKSGIAHYIKVHHILSGDGHDKGRHLSNMLPDQQDTTINTIIKMDNNDQYNHIVFISTDGYIRKSRYSDFKIIRSNGKKAFPKDFQLFATHCVNDDDEVLIASKKGKIARFSTGTLRTINSRDSKGVKAISIGENDEIVSSCSILPSNDQIIVTISSDGLGKKTPISEYRLTSRNCQGVKVMNLNENEQVIFVGNVTNAEIITLFTNTNMIKVKVANIPKLSRNTKGVKLIDTQDKVIKGEIINWETTEE